MLPAVAQAYRDFRFLGGVDHPGRGNHHIGVDRPTEQTGSQQPPAPEWQAETFHGGFLDRQNAEEGSP
ncbi:hypothetical protein D3C81_2163620 [compost metagenome]